MEKRQILRERPRNEVLDLIANSSQARRGLSRPTKPSPAQDVCPSAVEFPALLPNVAFDPLNLLFQPRQRSDPRSSIVLQRFGECRQVPDGC